MNNKIKLFLFCLLTWGLSFQAQASIDYDKLDLEIELARVCHVVGGHQQGADHIQVCESYADEVLEKGQGLIQLASKICFDESINSSFKCLGTLSYNYYIDYFPAPAFYHFSWEEIKNKLPLLLTNKTFDELKESEDSFEKKVFNETHKKIELIRGWQMNAMDAMIYVCSSVSSLGKEELTQKCFHEGFYFLERTR